MQPRLVMGKIQPEAYKAMMALDHYIVASGFDKLKAEMIKLRASQINGCAYCVNMHSIGAKKLGETDQRINLVCVWREAGDIFTEEEKIILAMTEEVTLIHQKGLSEELYSQALAVFSEEVIAQIVMVIITINAWNRIGVSFHMHP